MGEIKMLNLSITAMDTDHIDEICEDLIDQQRSGVSTHAMLMMTFNPEGTPAVDKATEQCKKYDLFRKRLDAAGAKHGVLVQATLGHIIVPSEPYEFQPSVFLSTGEERVVTCCPLDPNFRRYIKGQFKTLAKHKPSIVMIDDDMGLIYKSTKGCACKYHMAEFNKRAGTNMSREELYLHTQGNSEEDKHYTEIYVGVVRDGLVGAAKAMREGLDEIDPTIQGAVSGIYTSSFCEFSGDVAAAFAGKNNPKIVRMNGGAYSAQARAGGARYFTNYMCRAALLRECVKDKVDIFLAETDACSHNRYATSAAMLHSHFTASILEGASGAKHWITRLCGYEPDSGRAYRKKLAKYAGFYERLIKYAGELKPFGCRIPLFTSQNYQLKPTEFSENFSAWSACVLERLGLPTYFSNDVGGAVFLDDFSAGCFNKDEISSFLSGTLLLSAVAAKKLNDLGFIEYTGVEVDAWNGKVIYGERIGKNRIAAQYGVMHLNPINDKVEALSAVVYREPKNNVLIDLYPGTTRLKNSLGGEVIVFSGSPDMPFKYFTSFSMLNEVRKRQLIEILSESGNLPLYYPEDAELYLRAGYLPDGRIMAAVFNLSHDVLEELPLVIDRPVMHVERLNEIGEAVECEFEYENGKLTIKRSVLTLDPLVLFIS